MAALRLFSTPLHESDGDGAVKSHMPRGTARVSVAAARALGWTSVGIGLAQIIAPAQVQQLLGLDDNGRQRGILRVLGLREIMHGIGLLTERGPSRQMAAGLNARVMGDVLDTALLGIAVPRTREPASFAAVAGSVMMIGLLDFVFAQRVQRQRQRR